MNTLEQTRRRIDLSFEDEERELVRERIVTRFPECYNDAWARTMNFTNWFTVEIPLTFLRLTDKEMSVYLEPFHEALRARGHQISKVYHAMFMPPRLCVDIIPL
jgi:hypothetical protein